MAKYKRYTVNLEAYLFARNDREAMVKAAKAADFLKTLEDNQAKVIRLTETPFASFDSREVHSGSLTIFENKLIEVL